MTSSDTAGAISTAPQQGTMNLFINPLLDPFASLQEGSISNHGGPLNRLNVPQVETLIYTTKEVRPELESVLISVSQSTFGMGPVSILDEEIGIELSLTMSAHQTKGTIGTETIAIPTNREEVRDVLHMVLVERKGSKKKSFGIKELKQIANNLDLHAGGSKKELAERIRSHIIQYFNLPNKINTA